MTGLEVSRNQIAHLLLFLVRKLHRARALLLGEVVVHPLQKFRFDEEFFVAPLGGVLRAVEAALHRLHVREDEFQIDGADVAHGVDGALDVRDVLVLETAHDVDDGVHLADVREEFIPQPLAVRGALDQPRDVHELDDGGGDLLAVVQGGELVQPLVRHGDDAHVGFDGAEGIVRGFRARVRDRVEQRRFSYVRQAYYA